MQVDMKVHVVVDYMAVRKAVKQAEMPRLLQCGAIVEGIAKKSMRGGWISTGNTKVDRSAFGKQYGSKHRGSKKTHDYYASAPGSPPHVRTGNLRNSITFAPTSKGTVVVGPTRMAWYGAVHEFGGRHHPRRPFMWPALLEAVKKFPQKFKDLPIAQTPIGRALNSKRNPK